MTTYAAMRQTFIDLLNRTDFTDPNAALVKEWFDQSIQRIQREVRAPHMERTLNMDTTAAEVSSVTFPNDWLQSKALVWDDGTPSSGEIDEVDIGTYYRRKNAIFVTQRSIPARAPRC
jgi:peptide methionine sulfoxide reductase MsrA